MKNLLRLIAVRSLATVFSKPEKEADGAWAGAMMAALCSMLVLGHPGGAAAATWDGGTRTLTLAQSSSVSG